MKVFTLLGEKRDIVAGAVLKHQGDAAAGADLPESPAAERRTRRAPGSFANSAFMWVDDRLVLFLRRFAFVPFLQRDEKEAAVGGIDAGEEVEADDRGIVLDARRVLQNLFDPAAYRVCSLQGGGIGQDDLGE